MIGQTAFTRVSTAVHVIDSVGVPLGGVVARQEPSHRQRRRRAPAPARSVKGARLALRAQLISTRPNRGILEALSITQALV